MSLFIFNEDLQSVTEKGYRVMKDNHIKRVVDSYGQETDDYSAAAGGESSAATAQAAVTVVLDSAKKQLQIPKMLT